MKIHPAPFSDFGAAEGGTVMPKKIWRRRRRQNHWRKKFAAAEGGRIVKETRNKAWRRRRQYKRWTKFDAAEDCKTLLNFFFASGFVWSINKVWRLLHSEEFRFGVVRLKKSFLSIFTWRLWRHCESFWEMQGAKNCDLLCNWRGAVWDDGADKRDVGCWENVQRRRSRRLAPWYNRSSRILLAALAAGKVFNAAEGSIRRHKIYGNCWKVDVRMPETV